MKALVTPVLLCGGSGTRLWPLSRQSFPKQFVPLVGEESLFQASARRLSGSDGEVDFAAPMVLTNADFRFLVVEQLQGAGIDPGAILIEPAARNTAPAVLAATLRAAAEDPDAILLVAPSDHVVPDSDAFQKAVSLGIGALETGKMVTFGITPTHGETAYGYLELDGSPDGQNFVDLKSFVEKPTEDRADEMVAAGRFLWNAGIFLFRARDMLAAFEAHAPEMIPSVQAALDDAVTDLGFLRLDPDAWSGLDDISIDYAVMERATNLAVVPYGAGWSDLGSWNAVWQETGPDADGVATSGSTTAIDCTNSLLRSDSDRLELVGIGLDNIVAVAMNDAVLIADKSRSQDVKLAVNALKDKDAPQATLFPKDYRPWGWFESLATGTRFQVKRIMVKPGASLSLQSHFHRSEHWIVVQGTAKVTVDDDIRLVTENESIYVPVGAVHRLENPGKLPMVLIEVQTGAYVGEDDIVRYEDAYSRS